MKKWYTIYEGMTLDEDNNYTRPDFNGMMWIGDCDKGTRKRVKCDTVECTEYFRSCYGPVLATDKHDALDGILVNHETGSSVSDFHDVNGKPWLIAKEMKSSEVNKLKKQSWYLVKLLEKELDIGIDTGTNGNPTNAGLQAIVNALVSKKIIHGELT